MNESIFWSSQRVVPVFFVLSILTGVVYRKVAKRTRWPSWPTLGAGIALAGVLAVTLTPDEWDMGEKVTCIFSLPTTLGLFALPALTQDSLNALLLLPLGFFSVLATRRAWMAALTVVMTPICIELIQALVPVLDRTCSSQDIINNISGGLLGVALGILIQGLVRWMRPS